MHSQEVFVVEEGTLLWEPSQGWLAQANVSAYLAWLARREGRLFGSYDDLWSWTVSDVDTFWETMWTYFDVPGSRGDGPVRRGSMPDVSWFPDARLNYARQALRRRDDHPAVVFRAEPPDAGSGAAPARTLTYGDLYRAVAETAAGLRALGVRRGDRVVAYAPNTPETLIAFLAAASIGAVWSSCSPDFGAHSVIDRFAQVEPKVLVAVDGYRYAGKAHDRLEVVREIETKLPTVEATVLLPYLSERASPEGLRAGMTWQALARPASEPEFEEVSFDHPLWIVYSSGTTGLPKPIVHGHGGVTLEHLKALSFHLDLGPDDVFFWYTTTGWMMWNFLVGGLLLGATIVVYDGSATYPDLETLWRLAAETGVTYLGTGAPYLSACAKAGRSPAAHLDLSRLRAIGSTGSPLPPEAFEWVYRELGPDVLLGSFSGGTDLCTGFVGPSPLLPVRAGVIQCRCLGAKVEAFDEGGESVVDEVGELVITEPMPSMPLFFWNDPDGARYRESYFEDYPGVWRHGDWIKVRRDGGCVIYGRSDSTLNRGGVRMGTSEFYRVVDRFPEIEDSLVIDTGRLGQEGRLVLFLDMAQGHALDDDLARRLRSTLRSELSPRHAPDEMHEVPGIPRTLSGKKLEVPIRKILLGAPVERAANPDSMANPDVLDSYASVAAKYDTPSR